MEFVVGDLMAAEGGSWNPEDSPLKSPFGVDFNSQGDMWIVELEGGRVHKFDAAGKLRLAGGDGTKSYKETAESWQPQLSTACTTARSRQMATSTSRTAGITVFVKWMQRPE